MIKTWRPEINHLFVFHVQKNKHAFHYLILFLYYQVLILSSTCSKPEAASCEAGQLLTQNPLMVRLLLEVVSAYKELILKASKEEIGNSAHYIDKDQNSYL